MDAKAEQAKRDAEYAALRARWAIFWLLIGSALCLGVYFGLFIGFQWFGG